MMYGFDDSSVIIYFLRVRWNSPNIMFGWSRQNSDEMAILSYPFYALGDR